MFTTRVNGTNNTAYVDYTSKTTKTGGANNYKTTTTNTEDSGYQDSTYLRDDTSSYDSSSSLNELYEERATRQGEVESAESNYDTVISKDEENVKSAEEAYDKAVKEDENISKELKEKEAKLSEKITENETKIAEASQQYEAMETKINSIDAQISTLNGQISQLQGLINSCATNTKDKDANAKNAEQKAMYETILANKKSEIDQLNSEKDSALEKQTEAYDTKENCTRALDSLKLDKIILDKEISESCSQETKDAKTALDEAKSTAETNKTDAQTELDAAREALSEIEAAISNHKDMPPFNTADVAVAMLGDKEYRDWEDMYKEASEYDERIGLVEGEWCAGLTTYALAKAFDGLENIPGNFNEDCENHNTCYSYAHWAKDQGILMDKREDAENYDIKKVQPGDLILFNTYNDKSGENVDEWCHIGIVIGISDDGKTVYTIEGNTKLDDDSYCSGGSGILAKKTRQVNGGDFYDKHGDNLGTSYILMHNLTGKK